VTRFGGGYRRRNYVYTIDEKWCPRARGGGGYPVDFFHAWGPPGRRGRESPSSHPSAPRGAASYVAEVITGCSRRPQLGVALDGLDMGCGGASAVKKRLFRNASAQAGTEENELPPTIGDNSRQQRHDRRQTLTAYGLHGRPSPLRKFPRLGSHTNMAMTSLTSVGNSGGS
jgi:hypothetical protein